MSPTDVKPWLAGLLQDEGFAVSHMALKASEAWALREGGIRHRSGRFFSVVGVRAVAADGALFEQPLLEQREIGTLAFMLRPGEESPEVLVQAKVEPGNVGAIQLAPTFQATDSNASRVHGGTYPPLHDWFMRRLGQNPIASSLQSEQGTRFLGKCNRNVTLVVDEDIPHRRYHRWIRSGDLCACLAEDHLVNTDARSALVCSPWEVLAGGVAFSGGGFAGELRASHELPDDEAFEPLAAVVAGLTAPASWREEPAAVALDRLNEWHLGEEGPEPSRRGAFRLRHVRVHARSREVPSWDQPIVQSAGCGQVILPLGRFRGCPHLLFRTTAEPGFGSRVELTPAWTVAPGDPVPPGIPFLSELVDRGREIVACRQSEEGGRFLFDENRYALIDVGDVMPPPPGFHWLSLAQTRSLLARGKSLTNEARSAISLLLRWL